MEGYRMPLHNHFFGDDSYGQLQNCIKAAAALPENYDLGNISSVTQVNPNSFDSFKDSILNRLSQIFDIGTPISLNVSDHNGSRNRMFMFTDILNLIQSEEPNRETVSIQVIPSLELIVLFEFFISLGIDINGRLLTDQNINLHELDEQFLALLLVFVIMIFNYYFRSTGNRMNSSITMYFELTLVGGRKIIIDVGKFITPERQTLLRDQIREKMILLTQSLARSILGKDEEYKGDLFSNLLANTFARFLLVRPTNES